MLEYNSNWQIAQRADKRKSTASMMEFLGGYFNLLIANLNRSLQNSSLKTLAHFANNLGNRDFFAVFN
jgi:hypothetical protein